MSAGGAEAKSCVGRIAKPLSVAIGSSLAAAPTRVAPGIRQSACAGAVKSSWVMPGKRRKTMVVAGSVMRMVPFRQWITQARG